MLKIVSMFDAPAGTDPTQYRRDFVAREAPRLRASLKAPRHLVAVLMDVKPQWPAGFAPPASRPPCDVLTETWCDTPEEARAIATGFGAKFTYRVTEWVEKDVPLRPGDPPRIRQMSCITGKSGMSPADVQRHWREHVPLALRVHKAMVRYVRNWVDEPLTPGAPKFSGIACLTFRTKEDLEQRLFDSAEGLAEVIADTAEFVGDRAGLFGTEHDLRD